MAIFARFNFTSGDDIIDKVTNLSLLGSNDACLFRNFKCFDKNLSLDKIFLYKRRLYWYEWLLKYPYIYS